VKKVSNQDPQPEEYTVNVTALAAAGSQSTKIEHRMNTGEELRVYAMHVNYTVVATKNLKGTLKVGANQIPTNKFDLDWINACTSKTHIFSSPVLCLPSQSLYAEFTNEDSAQAATAIITFTAEISIAKKKEK